MYAFPYIFLQYSFVSDADAGAADADADARADGDAVTEADAVTEPDGVAEADAGAEPDGADDGGSRWGSHAPRGAMKASEPTTMSVLFTAPLS